MRCWLLPSFLITVAGLPANKTVSWNQGRNDHQRGIEFPHIVFEGTADSGWIYFFAAVPACRMPFAWRSPLAPLFSGFGPGRAGLGFLLFFRFHVQNFRDRTGTL